MTIGKSKRVTKFWRQPVSGYDPWNCDLEKYEFSRDVAERVCEFFPKYLRHEKGEHAGRPFILEPWQKQFVGHLFGWKEKATGMRRFRESLLYIPKKNGKTALGAGLGLLMLVADGEQGAEVYSAAGDTEQARLLFDFACFCVTSNEALAGAVKIFRGYKSMEFGATNSRWRVLSSEAKTKHGPNPHCILVDELHVQDNWDLIDTLVRGVVSRKQPLVVYMTTADYDRDSPCNEIYDRASKIRLGEIEDHSFFPVIFEATDDDDWTSEEVWKRANPNYGITLQPDYFRAEVAKAKSQPSKEYSFKRLHLNIRTTSKNKWIDLTDWDKSGDAGMSPDILDGERCYGSIDLGSVDDLTCFGLYFPDKKAFLLQTFTTEVMAQKRIEYQAWARQGYMVICPGRVSDPQYVRRAVVQASERYEIIDVAYDPWNADAIARQLQAEDGIPVIEFRQGYRSMNEPSKALEKLIATGAITHFRNPVLRWMISNCSLLQDPAGNIKPVKPTKDSAEKIDGVICLVMGVGLSMTDETEPEKPSVYESRGLITL